MDPVLRGYLAGFRIVGFILEGPSTKGWFWGLSSGSWHMHLDLGGLRTVDPDTEGLFSRGNLAPQRFDLRASNSQSRLCKC